MLCVSPRKKEVITVRIWCFYMQENPSISSTCCFLAANPGTIDPRRFQTGQSYTPIRPTWAIVLNCDMARPLSSFRSSLSVTWSRVSFLTTPLKIESSYLPQSYLLPIPVSFFSKALIPLHMSLCNYKKKVNSYLLALFPAIS